VIAAAVAMTVLMLMLRAIAFVVAAALIVVAIALAVEAFFGDGGQDVELILIRGDKALLVALGDDLHDIDVMLAIAFLILALRGKIHENRVFLVLILEIIDYVKFKLVTVVIGERYKIPFVFHGVALPFSYCKMILQHILAVYNIPDLV